MPATKRCPRGKRRYPAKTGRCISKNKLLTQPHGRYLNQKQKLEVEINSLTKELNKANEKIKDTIKSKNVMKKKYKNCKTNKQR